MSEETSDRLARGTVKEVAGYFLKLGFTAFGGPAAHIALMEDQLVNRRGWLDRRHFLDLVAAINFIPGPNSTELAIHLGYLRAGFRGLLAAGVCFILPAVLIIIPLGWLYVTQQQRPQVQGVFLGVNAAVVAIVAAAAFRLAKTGLKDGFAVVVAIFALGGEIVNYQGRFPAGDVVILACAGLAGAFWYGRPVSRATGICVAPGPVAFILAGMGSTVFATGMGLMALLFLKIGATLFGSGYLLLPYLQDTFVRQHQWLSDQQVLNAVAVGQVTPGPLLTTATFIGFVLGYGKFGGGLMGGIAGAFVATAAIFAPAFLFIAVLGPVLPRIRQSPLARGALDAMNAAVVAIIASAVIFLGEASFHTGGAVVSGILMVGTLIALLVWNINATWLLAGAAIVGWIFKGINGGLDRIKRMNAKNTQWPVAEPAEMGMIRAVLDGELSDLLERTKTGGAALVVKGKLVWEKYWGPFGAESRFDTMSIGKAFAAAAIGILQDDGLLNVDDLACKYLPEWKEDGRKKITIRHLLTMTSGLKYDFDGFAKDADANGSALNWPMVNEPGKYWCYEQATSQALCPIILRVSGQQPIELLRERILGPIGARGIGWMRSVKGDCLTYRSVLSSARDMCRFGWLLHEGGKWNGKQLLSADYVEHLTHRDALEEKAAIYPGQEDYRRRNYAWSLFVNADNVWEGVGKNCFAPLGSVGNMCLVDIHKHFVFARFSTPEGVGDTSEYKSELDVTDKGTALAWRTVLKAFG